MRQKQVIAQEFELHEAGGRNCCKFLRPFWAEQILRLYEVPTQSIINRLLHVTAGHSVAVSYIHLKGERTRPSAAPRPEDAFYYCMCSRSSCGDMLNAVLGRKKGAQLLKNAKNHLPVDEQLSLQFSKKWVERVKERYVLCFHFVYREAMSADVDAFAWHNVFIRAVAELSALPDI